MNKKNVIICISALVLLMAVVAAAIVHLYWDTSGEIHHSVGTPTGSVTGPTILSAVPYDAVFILSSRQLRTTLDLVNDDDRVLGQMFSGNPSFARFLGDIQDILPKPLENASNSISLHYSGSLVPLMVVDLGRSPDSTFVSEKLVSAAESASLEHTVVDCRSLPDCKLGSHLLLVSPSEILITSSRRHLESGTSVYDRPYFSDIAPLPSGRVVLYIANGQVHRLTNAYMGKKSGVSGDFFSKLSSWTAFSLDQDSEDGLTVQGYVVADEDPANFINIFRNSPTSDIQAMQMLPASTVYALGVVGSKMDVYIDNYSSFLDAVRHLDDYKVRDAEFRSTHEMSAKQWASRLKIKEVVKARYRGSSSTEEVLLIRVGKEVPEILLKGSGAETMKDYDGSVFPYPYKGVIGLLFGKGLSLENEDCAAYMDGWLVVGSAEALDDYTGGGILDQDLKTLFGGPNLKDMNFFCYFSVTEETPILDDMFKPAIAQAIRRGTDGMAYEPVLLTIGSRAENVTLTMSRHRFIENSEVAMAKARLDTSVVIPVGPFKVYNCGTKTTNLLSQNPNLSLSLSEENGKALWSIPMKEKLCGRVEQVDFYKNGKIQFLFCAGSSIYLLDRLGRFVNGFPKDLGKPVKLGPAVYDFEGRKEYTAVVLHGDNTIEMYLLDGGSRPAGWETIKASETIKDLPELLVAEGKRYWVVRTAVQLSVHRFEGGEPLVGGKGGKSAIRPDSPLTVSGGMLTATCADGKQRQFKLE